MFIADESAEHKTLWYHTLVGEHGVASKHRAYLSPKQYPAGYVLSTARPINIPDTSHDKRVDNDELKQMYGVTVRNVLSVAVPDTAGRIVAVLQVANRFHASFTRNDEMMLQCINKSGS